MIRIHLYGDLRRYCEQSRPDRDSIINLPTDGDTTVAQVLQRAGIPPAEVAQIFLNGRLLQTTNSMAPWLGYQTAQEGPLQHAKWDTPVRSGDRLGLFPGRMAMLVV